MNAVPAPAQATATAPKATAKKAPAKKAVTKAPAKKATAKAPAKKAAPAKSDKPKTPTVAERDMTTYDAAMAEYKELKRDIADHIAGIAYQARRSVPDPSYAKGGHDEAMAKFTSAVAALRETARLLSEVAPKK